MTLSDNLKHTLPSTDAGLEDLLCSKAEFELLKQAFNNLSEEEQELITFVYLKNNSLTNYAYWKNMCYSTANRRKRIIVDKMKLHIDNYMYN